ncbi:MAG: hypothetical protein ACYS0I_09000, partial [Planctomycetota bacterium]
MFFTILFLWPTDGKLQVIINGVLLGMVLCGPLYFLIKNEIKKKIEGTTIYYKQKQYLRSLIVVVPIIILSSIFFRLEWGRKI